MKRFGHDQKGSENELMGAATTLLSERQSVRRSFRDRIVSLERVIGCVLRKVPAPAARGMSSDSGGCAGLVGSFAGTACHVAHVRLGWGAVDRTARILDQYGGERQALD
jgi:hypothetical protein